jgi:serine/threonine protein kinase
MAPEQVEGKEADEWTDIFAFGAVVYEMVTGRKAFEGRESGEFDWRDSEGHAAANHRGSAGLPTHA